MLSHTHVERAFNELLPEAIKLLNIKPTYTYRGIYNGMALTLQWDIPPADNTQGDTVHVYTSIAVMDFPKFCGGNVIGGIYVPYTYQCRGIGTFLVKLITRAYELQSKALGAGVLFATTSVQESPGADRIMRKLRWTRGKTFRNPNTGHIVTWWTKLLVKARPAKDSRTPKPRKR